MKNWLYFLGLMLFFSCSKPLNEPKKLVSKDVMSEIISEFAINDQLSFVNSGGNLDTSTRYVLKKYKITGDNFSESYKYYMVTGELNGIFDKAQDVLKSKDPDAETYIDKKLKEQKNVPPIAR